MNIRNLFAIALFSVAMTACYPVPAQNTEVIVDSPVANATVSSPLTVKGKAKGPWFFEASLPVLLVDEDGNVIVQGPAQAQGEWMTTEFVDFEATLTFTTTATSGYLIVRKDNPSGLPENDKEFKVPVKF